MKHLGIKGQKWGRNAPNLSVVKSPDFTYTKTFKQELRQGGPG